MKRTIMYHYDSWTEGCGCCSNGKPYGSLTEAERIGGCNHDNCVGPIEVEEFYLLLTGLGTFNTEDCINVEELGKLIFKKGE